ncbi:hypothetical protein M758_5G101200 [Ceratodon purpureus]|nr:hypothetical protein M758_5G101200 [Ceratodon purpureus]KAG0616242.1 hypothetical protein M758_5G101200 [Ceratodon purpureus]
MEYNREWQVKLGAIVLFLSFLTCAASDGLGQKTVACEYNRTRALVLVEYASAVYIIDDASLLSWTCSRCKGLTKGFKIHTLIVDVQHCLQAFVGVAENMKAIIIAFRGTQDTSMQNWAEDLYFRELDLDYPGVIDAMVHRGFYAAYHNTTLRERVVGAVQDILQARSDLGVMITGHSMGGAMATFCALDLSANYGFKNVEVITFGQPRVGNQAFSVYYNEHVPLTIRVTHAHDVVPHLPPYYPFSQLVGEKTYHHFATEVWIFRVSIGRLQLEFERVCDGSGDDIGEDPSCSRSVAGNSIADHLNYYGVFLSTEDDVLGLQNSSTGTNTSQMLGFCKTSVPLQRF